MTDQQSGSLSDRLDSLFSPFARSDAPGLVVGVAHQGKTIYRKGFGLASIEHAVANTPATRMRIGSTSKHFTCLAVLLLAEEGKLDVDDSIGKYLPELPKLEGEPTLRQLMSHTSGYRCHLDLGSIANGRAIQPRGTALTTQLRQTGVNFKPGAKMIYCNNGYHLLSLMIEKITGMSFEQFLAVRIFEPLGMSDTSSVPNDFEIHHGVATLHVALPAGGYLRGIFPSEELLGEGSMVSTIDDMMLWLAHLRGKKLVGSEGSWQQLQTRARLNDGEELEYCLGLLRGNYRGVEVLHHAGGVVGGLSQMLTAPDQALDIIIIANGAPANPIDLANQVIDLVLGDDILKAPTEKPEIKDYKSLLGRYRAAKSRLIFDLVDIDGKLGLGVLTNPGLPLDRHGNSLQLLFSRSGMGPYRIEMPELKGDAPPKRLKFYDCGETDRLERIDANTPDPGEMAGLLCGSYFSADLDTQAHITFKNNRLDLTIHGHLGGNSLTLEPITEETMSFIGHLPIQQLRGTIHLERRGNTVTSFNLNTPRTRHLHFARQP